MRPGRGAVVQVVISVPSAEVGRGIASVLLDARLSACVQIVGPVESHYRWKGKIEQADEWLLLVKTRSALLEALEAEVQRSHPYEVPEILALPVHSGHAAYLAWLESECLRRAPAKLPATSASAGQPVEASRRAARTRPPARRRRGPSHSYR